MLLAGVEEQLQQRRLAMRPKKSQYQIVYDGEVVERGGELKRTHHAAGDSLLRRFPGDIRVAKMYRTFVRRKHAGEQVEECGLTGAIRSDNAGYLMFMQRIAHLVDSNQCAEPLGDVSCFNDFQSYCTPLRERRSRAAAVAMSAHARALARLWRLVAQRLQRRHYRVATLRADDME